MAARSVFVLVVVLLLMAGWGFHLRYEFVTESVDEGPGPLARRDALLAARRYLEAGGTQVAVADRQLRDHALQPAGTLIIGPGTELASARQASQILHWVALGGHLILSARADPDDLVLPTFGLSHRHATRANEADEHCAPLRDDARQAPGERTAAHAATSLESPQTDPAPNSRAPMEIIVDGFAEPLLLDFNPYRVLVECRTDNDIERSLTLHGPHGIVLIEHVWGLGHVTVSTDQDIWSNVRIGLFDHALLLETLVDPLRPVLILHGSPVPSLLALIAAHGREALLAASLFLLAWLLRRGRRFGPLRTIEHTQRRALGEHILAASRYRWRRGGAVKLLEGARRAVLDRARRCLPGLAEADPAEQCKHLAQHTGLPPEAVQSALLADISKRTPELQTIASNLQALWIRL